MKFNLPVVLILTLLTQTAFPQAGLPPTSVEYSTGQWDADSLGNHRVVLSVTDTSHVVKAVIPWRRRDVHPEQKNLLLFNAQGTRVQNLYPADVNREYGELYFEADTPGQYFLYYLPAENTGRSNYPTYTYPAFTQTASAAWLKKAKATRKRTEVAKATVENIESIDELNSFYPMELIATQQEVEKLEQANPGKDYLLFAEDRAHAIKMTDDVPYRWIANPEPTQLEDHALRGEYLAFQVGLYAFEKEIDAVRVRFSGLRLNEQASIPDSAFTCFNTEGVTSEGDYFKKNINVQQGKVQALWCGVQIPENAAPGWYTGTVTIQPANAAPQEVGLRIQVADEVIKDHGDDEPAQLARLRWLNSRMGFDDGLVKPYTALQVSGRTIHLLGREVTLDPLGFPESIKSYFSESVTKLEKKSRELLQAPIALRILANGKALRWENQDVEFTARHEGRVSWKATHLTDAFRMDYEADLEMEGFLDFRITLIARQTMSVDDIVLDVPLKADMAKYMLGLGKKGGYLQDTVDWKWDVEKNQDGAWIGDVNAGLQVRLRDTNYDRPLNTNFYQLKPLNLPPSWYNDGAGGIRIDKTGQQPHLIQAYSGKRTVQAGDTLNFYFSLLITPFRTIDTDSHWKNRYYHAFVPIDTVEAYGANVINVHHANQINPYINYPFLRPDEMKAYIDQAHQDSLRVKIYYTVRELSNRAPEVFALRSLGNEILSDGPGGGYSWLQEHLGDNYIAAWFVPDLKDAAIVNSGVSRWHNYYVEGLHWLVEHIGIDGLYIDDVAFDRITMKRVRKVLDRSNPASLIDLHSANQFNPRDGFANSANLYMEHFPYIDRLWFGEYFDYDAAPDFWITEMAGIPFGLMGEMLQDGGNPWRGMLFGMTSRAPWSGDPAPIWGVWDQFGMEGSEMIGFWDSAVPVHTNDEKIKATVYQKEGSALISLGSWHDNDATVRLDFNWKSLGLDPDRVKVYAPPVKDFQQEATFTPTEAIPVKGKQGLLLIVESAE